MGYLKSFRYLGYLGPIDVLSIWGQIVPFQDSRPTAQSFQRKARKGRNLKKKKSMKPLVTFKPNIGDSILDGIIKPEISYPTFGMYNLQ